MEYKLENEEVIAYRKTTRYQYEVESSKGEIRKIARTYWIVDCDYETDSDEDWYLIDDNGHETSIDWDEMQEWLGEEDDVDDLQDNLRDLAIE